MSDSPSLPRTENCPESYRALLDLTARLTGARRAAFLPVEGPGGLLASGTGQDLPDFYWEAAREVVRNPIPQMFQSPGRKSCSPLLAVPVQHRNNLLGVMIVSHRPQRPLNRDDLNLVALLAENPSLVSQHLALQERNTGYLLDSIQALVRTLEARDHYTGQHCGRVTEIALQFGLILGLASQDLQAIKTTGLLHDIGKVGISDRLLLKPGPLTPDERRIIETHPLIGEKIIRPLSLMLPEREIILHHHERWNGQGYPHGLAGEKIPFLCRLVALADVFDALTSDRPYRGRFSTPQALETIRAQAGTHFDPGLAEKFVRMISSQTQSPPLMEKTD